jgi:protein O-mannosyl-transferase
MRCYFLVFYGYKNAKNKKYVIIMDYETEILINTALNIGKHFKNHLYLQLSCHFIMPKKVSVFVKISIVILCFVFYGNTLTNEYSMDDHFVIVDNPKIAQGIEGIPHIFKTHYIESDSQRYGYRPITLSVFAIEHQFFGVNPVVSHFINLILYCLTCLVLLGALTKLFHNYHWLLPVLVVGLFLIHPIHSEVVNNVKSRDELLSFLFGLLALRTAITYVSKDKLGYLFLSLLLFAISLLSKLSSLTFLAIIPLALYFFENVKGKKLIGLIFALTLVVIGVKLGEYLLIDSYTLMREMRYIENPLFFSEGNMLSRIPMAFYTIGYYIKLLVWPYPLLFYYGFDQIPIVSWDSIWAWISILLVLPLMVYTIFKLKTKHVVVFGLAYFFISISMFSNLVIPAVGIIAERFAYGASLGFCVVLAYGLLKIFKVPVSDPTYHWKPNYALISAFGLLAIITGAQVMSRNADWESEITLAQNDSKHLKKSAKANALLGDYLLIDMNKATAPATKRKLAQNALLYYNRSLKVYDSNGTIYNNLGVIHYQLGNYEKAISNIKNAHDLDAVTGNSYFNLGASYTILEDYESAADSFEKSIATNPNYVNSYNQLMKLYFKIGQYDKAMAVNLRAVKQFPEQLETIIKAGLQIAMASEAKSTYAYIDVLLSQGFIDTQLHRKLKSEIATAVQTPNL